MRTFKRIVGVLGGLVLTFALVNQLGLIPDGSSLSVILESILGGSGAMLAMAAGVTPDNEAIVKGGVEVGDITDGHKPAYVAEELDQMLVQIKPSDFVLDTLTREIKNTAKANNIVTGGFEIGTRDALDVTTAAVAQGAANATVQISVSKPGMWLKGDVLVIGGTLANGKTLNDSDALADIAPSLDNEGKPISLYVSALGGDGTSIVCRLINSDSSLAAKVPAIEANTVLIRLSNAVNETTAIVDAWQNLPGTYQNYCQIHMRLVQESYLHKIMDKNTKFDFSLMRDQTLYDMKMGMERQNWLGVKNTFPDANGKIVYTSDGVWAQIENQINISAATAFTDDVFMNAIARPVFSNNNGAETRILVAGNGLMSKFYNASSYTKQIEAKEPVVKFGIKFQHITTPYGDLLIKPMGSLFAGAWENCGAIIDPNYIVKKQLEPLQTTKLELDKTGQSRSDAVRIHETYCLMVQNQPVHSKIVIS